MNLVTLAPILRFVLTERSMPVPPRLESMATFLPAVPTAGIEFSLTGDGTIDLQQRIRSGHEADRLESLLRDLTTSCPMPDGSSWQALMRFCDEKLLEGDINEIWIELDDKGLAGPPPVSVFVRLPAGWSPSRSLETVEQMLAGFGAEVSEARRRTLTLCFDACPPPSLPSHIGLMLGRSGAPICLIVEGITSDCCSSFLERAGWGGDIPQAQRRLDMLFTHVDRVRLSLTAGETLHPVLGFECFVGLPGDQDPRWQCVFDMLARERLCNEQQRERVFSWPGTLTPSSARSPWPGSLIVNALVRSPKEIGWLDCRISHVKITHHDDGPPRAKAYLGFVEIWEDVSRDPYPPSEPTTHGRSTTGVAGAVEAALKFLLAAQTQSGWWLDYPGFQEGVSDEWVTAYIAHALHETGDAGAVRAARCAWSRLERRSRGGWGWNFLQPADADSTLWALRLASRLQTLDSKRARSAVAFLREHMQPGGGVATYLSDHHNSWSKGTRVNPSWFDAHLCVTAAVAGLEPLGEEPLNYIRNHQEPGGYWQGYWWKHPIYTTAHAAEALEWHGTPVDRDRVSRAARWAGNLLDASTANLDPANSPFNAALALRILLLVPDLHQSLIRETTQRLLAGQCADGSWKSSAILSVPNVLGQEVTALDRGRTFTTATVLRTLHRLRMLESSV